MLHKTRGIVVKVTDYSETSVVVQVLTEKFGLQSYLINGVKKPGAKIKSNSLQPLYLLEMVVYHKATANIQRAAEIRNIPVFQSIPYNILKSTLVLFLNEVIYRSARQQNEDEELFHFIFHGIELLDRAEDSMLANFHLVFLFRLTRFLGFYPMIADNQLQEFFDLRNGEFTNHMPSHTYFLTQPHTANWQELSEVNFETIQRLQLHSAERKYLLEQLLDYYRLHIDGFGEVRSLKILEEVMRG